jgi:hypothetical protein
VGYTVDNDNVAHGFIRSPHGHGEVFDVEGAGSLSGQGTTPWEINGRNEIAGVITDANNVNHGFIRGSDSCVE